MTLRASEESEATHGYEIVTPADEPDAATPEPDPTVDAAKRDRTVTTGIATAMASKGFGLAAPLIVTPVCFRYLGDERYGLWMAVTALTGMAWFADLGLGNGLLTRLSHLANDVPQQRREISSAYATLGVVAAVLLSGLVAANIFIPWDRAFSVADPGVAAETSVVVMLCFSSFLINIPLSLVQRVQYARGQLVQSNLWQSVGAFLSMAAVIGSVAAQWPPLLVIAGAVLAIPLSNLLNTLVYFGWQQPQTRPSLGQVRRSTAKSLLGLGLQFFVLTSMSSIALNLDSPLVAHVLGLAIAAHFAVVGKLFGVLSLFVGLVGMTLWSINGQALSQGDVAWVRRNTRKMVVLYGSIVGVAGLALVVFGHRIVELWIGTSDASVASFQVLSGLAVWSFLLAVTSPLMMVQNSVGLLRPQFIGWALFLIIATLLKFWGLQRFGLAGLPAAACISYLFAILPAAVIGYHKALNSCAVRQRRDTHG